MLARLFSSPCSREEDFEEVKEVIEAMNRLGRRERARELAALAERVLDQRFLRGLVAFLGRLDFSLRGQGGGVGVAKGELSGVQKDYNPAYTFISLLYGPPVLWHTLDLKGCEKGWSF